MYGHRITYQVNKLIFKNDLMVIMRVSGMMTRGTILRSAEDESYFNYIGTGILKMSRNEIFTKSNGIAVKMTNSIYKLPSFNSN